MGTAPGLRRALHLRDLIFMGLIIIQPTAPMPLFGVVSNKAGGHVVSAVLVAMVGMMLTAISYGRMARLYPSAGSAYTYVGREIHPTLGFLTPHPLKELPLTQAAKEIGRASCRERV